MANLFDVSGEVVLSPAGARRIRHGHLWVYAGDLVRDLDSPGPPLVRVTDAARNLLGYALHSPQSQIRLRLLSRGTEPPAEDLVRNRIRDSLARRQANSTGRRACRLVFAEADLLPSVIVDRYAEFLVLQTLSYGAEALKPLLVDFLRELVQPAGILERNDVKARHLEGLDEKRGILWGTVPPQVEIIEGGVRFLVDLMAGQKTGFYLDQSENRIAARDFASGRALDCFTNTGGFALHFATRCESVLAIDVSKESLQQARRSAEVNGMGHVDFREANAFDFLREMDLAGEKFDTLCLDPPAFAKNRGAIAGAKSGYKEINLRAMKLLRPEGILITSSCSYHLKETDFFELILQAAHDAHRYVQVLERRAQARDHPILASMPETHYLKCFILRVL